MRLRWVARWACAAIRDKSLNGGSTRTSAALFRTCALDSIVFAIASKNRVQCNGDGVKRWWGRHGNDDRSSALK